MGKILIIDDDNELRSLLSTILSAEGHEVTAADNGRTALNRIRKEQYDIILLDIKLPDMDGMKILEKIKKMNRCSAVIMLTGYGEIKDAVSAIKMGALNYITKPFENDEIILNVRDAFNKLNSRNALLTDREIEVLNWLKKGKTSWDISVILFISERTVNFHIKNIMQKLDSVSRTHAVARAIKMGIIAND